jgi:hypothetical protein
LESFVDKDFKLFMWNLSFEMNGSAAAEICDFYGAVVAQVVEGSSITVY